MQKTIANHELGELIGSGIYSNIYARINNNYQEKIAIKVLKQTRQEYAERFNLEFEILSSLSHPNILRVYDFGDGNGNLFFTMQRWENSLFDYLENPPFHLEPNERKFTMKEKMSLLQELLKGIEALHKKQIIHRDICPQNILINSDLSLCICDFGLAKVGETELTNSNKSNPKIYGAPEQDTLLTNATFHSDIYSFCVLAYQLLTGVLPKGNRIQNIQIFQNNFPTPLAQIIEYGLSTSPEERPYINELKTAFSFLSN